MPATAKENSEEGAEAFARWYVETLNHLYQYPQTGVLDKYAGDTCQTCAAQIRVMKQFVGQGARADRDVWSILGSSSSAVDVDTYQTVVAFRQDPAVISNSQGKEVYVMASSPEHGFAFDLRRDADWIVDAIYLNEDPYYEKDQRLLSLIHI
mgnify:CR=1 FL=1